MRRLNIYNKQCLKSYRALHFEDICKGPWYMFEYTTNVQTLMTNSAEMIDSKNWVAFEEVAKFVTSNNSSKATMTSRIISLNRIYYVVLVLNSAGVLDLAGMRMTHSKIW